MPFVPVRDNRSPLGEFTCTSTTAGPIEVHVNLVTPAPEPSQTWIGLGSAVIVAFFEVVDGGIGAFVLLGDGREQPSIAGRLTVRIMSTRKCASLFILNSHRSLNVSICIEMFCRKIYFDFNRASES